MCLCILASVAGACLLTHMSCSSFHSLIICLFYFPLSLPLCQLICSICPFPPWRCNWLRSSKYPVCGNSPSPDRAYVNEPLYASTNPLQCNSHLTLQRVDIRGEYHWFYIVAAWHWAHCSTLFMRANWEMEVWQSEGTPSCDLCISALHSTSRYSLLCKPQGQEGRRWWLNGGVDAYSLSS